MRLGKAFIALAVCAELLGGCMSFSHSHKVPLNEADYAPYLSTGTAIIAGTVSAKMRAGDISNGAESFVYLVPVTPYSTEWFEHAMVSSHSISGTDPRSLRAARATVVGPDGRFQFSKLPAGDYYLSCTITRSVPPFRIWRFRLGNSSIERVDTYARVTVQPGEQAQVLVTKPPS
ncbi:MAG TPA: hypothetical protein VGQ07_08385 [Nitrospirales bacterium]|nr:hypothetical protein [Nitrospirales bacterium]